MFINLVAWFWICWLYFACLIFEIGRLKLCLSICLVTCLLKNFFRLENTAFHIKSKIFGLLDGVRDFVAYSINFKFFQILGLLQSNSYRIKIHRAMSIFLL